MIPVTLHIVGSSPWASDALERCCRALGPADALLLIGDGVYAANAGSTPAARLAQLGAATRIHALDEDCAARGVDAAKAGIALVGYAGFVRLVAEHPRSVSWF